MDIQGFGAVDDAHLLPRPGRPTCRAYSHSSRPAWTSDSGRRDVAGSPQEPAGRDVRLGYEMGAPGTQGRVREDGTRHVGLESQVWPRNTRSPETPLVPLLGDSPKMNGTRPLPPRGVTTSESGNRGPSCPRRQRHPTLTRC